MLRAAAWSAPVIAAAFAVPLAAASADQAVLTFDVSLLVDVDAPYGTRTVRISNPSQVGFEGPLTFRMPSMAAAAPFALTGAVHSSDGNDDIWTIPSITIPAGETVMLDVTWPGPFPDAPHTQRLTVTTDPARGTITPIGNTDVTSPYQYLWAAVTPGGEGSPAGTTSIFIGNTTETPFNTPVSPRLPIWTLPQLIALPLSVNETRYAGRRTLENNALVASYPSIPVSVEARSGKELFTLLWGPASDPNAGAQQHRALISMGDLPVLGSPLIHSRYRAA